MNQLNIKNDNTYGKKYFEWQHEIGEFGGWANLIKFEKYIKKNDIVLDFGCGGGFLLNKINCRKKIGVDLNKTALETAKSKNILVYDSLDKVEDNSVDTIISNHALEHCDLPLNFLAELYKKLVIGGKLIIVVPCEGINHSYKENDRNHHLYTWSPMSLGNLVKKAGFKLIESKAFFHQWPPYYNLIAKITGQTALFHIVCKIYSRFNRKVHQCRAVATK